MYLHADVPSVDDVCRFVLNASSKPSLDAALLIKHVNSKEANVNVETTRKNARLDHNRCRMRGELTFVALWQRGRRIWRRGD